MTTAFYAPPDCFQGNQVSLPEEEARHAVQVLRHRVGDEIVVVDGAGGWYRVRIWQADRKRVVGEVVEMRREVGEPSFHLVLGLAVLRQQARWEWALEKAVELGVRKIVPLRTMRTEKPGVRRTRAEHILIAAMKQCGRSRLPELAAVTPLEHFLKEAEGRRLLAHERATQGMLERLASGEGTYAVAIGPEGGFAPEEVQQAAALGWEVVSLGGRRLRAETAAVVAASGIMLMHETGERHATADRKNTGE